MSIMKVLYSVFLLSILLISCKKGKTEFTLTGSISDNTFSQNHDGAVIKLYEVEAGGSITNLLETATLGNDGSYSFTFPRNKVESYTVVVTKDNYFTIDESIPFSSMTISSDNVRDFGTTAKSWAKIRLINSSPLGSDHLQITKQTGKSDCTECCDNNVIDFYGAIDTTYYCINDGNTIYSYFYSVLGTPAQGILSANTVAFDTIQISLTY